MKLSKSCIAAIYAVRALSALGPERYLSASKLAPECPTTKGFLLILMNKLVAAGIVESYRGTTGGYRLAKPPQEVTVLSVIEAVEGNCNFYFATIHRELTSALESITFGERL